MSIEWSIVPKKATREMCAAAVATSEALSVEEHRDAYAAMLAAAPEPPISVELRGTVNLTVASEWCAANVFGKTNCVPVGGNADANDLLRKINQAYPR